MIWTAFFYILFLGLSYGMWRLFLTKTKRGDNKVSTSPSELTADPPLFHHERNGRGDGSDPSLRDGNKMDQHLSPNLTDVAQVARFVPFRAQAHSSPEPILRQEWFKQKAETALLSNTPFRIAPTLLDPEIEAQEPGGDKPHIIMTSFGHSDRGMKRKNNEDALGIYEREGVFVVADGMGGYNGGAVASSMAVQAVKLAFTEEENLGVNDLIVYDEHLPFRANRIAHSIAKANIAIFETALAKPELYHMGTTLVVAQFALQKERVYIGHVGDSRVYRLRHGKLTQLTQDHTIGAFGITGPRAKDLSRAVGIAPTVKIDILIGKLLRGDVYLLCSDGLPKTVPFELIAYTLSAYSDARSATDELITLANTNGGTDNVTALVVHVN